MSSPSLSRCSSPSLESVSGLSDDEATVVVPRTQACKSVNGVHDAQDIISNTERLDLEDQSATAADTPESVGNDARSLFATDGSGLDTYTQQKLESSTMASIETLGKKHERYFFTAQGFLTFLVEGTVYRVHRYLFSMLSPFWAEKLASGEQEDAVRLDDVTKEEMDAFLSVLYLTSKQEAALEARVHWTAVLRLATMWKFEQKRKCAVTALELLVSPVEKLVLARTYDVEAWVHPAFVALCMRSEPLSLTEAATLALQDVLHITSAREALQKDHGDYLTEEITAAYITEHIIRVPETPIDTQSEAETGAILPMPVQAGSMAILPLSERPTVEEKQAFVTPLFNQDYASVIRSLDRPNVAAFYGLLVDFSNVLRSEATFTSFLPHLLHRGASDESFVAVGIQLLQTIVNSLPAFDVSNKAGDPYTSYNKSTTKLTRDVLKKILNEHVHELQTFWSDVEQAMSKHGDFVLGYAQATMSLSFTNSPIYVCPYPPAPSVPSKILGLDVHVKSSDEAVYEERSKSLRAFFSALVKDGLVDRLDL